MSALLLDASVWLAARDADDRHHAAARRLVDESADARPLAALDLTLYEVANVAVTSWGSEDRARTLLRLVHESCPGTIAVIDGQLADQAVALAAHHGLSVYDAAYVAAAQRHGWTLVSGDHEDLVRPGLAVTPGDAAGEG